MRFLVCTTSLSIIAKDEKTEPVVRRTLTDDFMIMALWKYAWTSQTHEEQDVQTVISEFGQVHYHGHNGLGSTTSFHVGKVMSNGHRTKYMDDVTLYTFKPALRRRITDRQQHLRLAGRSQAPPVLSMN